MKDIDIHNIASNFTIEGKIDEIKPLSGGLINASYLVTTDKGARYVLQKKNGNIFKNVPAMMENIINVTEHIRKKVKKDDGDTEREVMTVIFTPQGKAYHQDENGEYWTMSLFIPETLTIETADTPELAFKGGEGIGKFQRQLADFTKPLNPTIPGFHDLRFRFQQWDEALHNDKAKRAAKVSEEIKWVEKRRDEMLKFWELVETGKLPKRVTHNDTKISNILFDKEGNVLCVIDLDTVMSNTVLADYGDAIRSFTNPVPEDYADAEKAKMNLDIFNAYTAGFLSQTADSLTPTELEYLAFGPRYITFEQVLRFLMDYIDGDTYYHTEYPEHNLVRTHVQQKLLESMEENYDKMKQSVKDNFTKSKS